MAKNKRKKPVLKTVLITLAILGIVAIIALALAPQFLAKQATQAPVDTQTFVTRQIEETDLSQRMQSAVNNAAPERPDIQSPQDAQNSQITIETTEQTTPQNSSERTSNENPADDSAQLPPNTHTEVNPNFDAPPDAPPPGQIQNNTAQNPPQNRSDNRSDLPSERPVQRPVQRRAQPPAQQAAPRAQTFEFQISQNEISSMIYSGLINGTAPEFRQSIQGVSTQISGGRAKISVALLPKYLPDAFLRNLPGITRSTPTVYLGGELGLSVSGNTVEPRIHRVSLGNMGVPMPFIENAVRGQVQAYVRNATRLPNGQQAQLQNVRLESGAIHIQGRVD